MYAVFDQLDVDDVPHAFYVGKELMKATIARGLHKSYRQEGPPGLGRPQIKGTTLDLEGIYDVALEVL